MAVSKVLLEQDRLAKLVKTSNTVVTLGALTVTTSVSGVNGIDTGVIAASSFYYVYTVISGGQVRLVASLSASAPTGFTNYRKVGSFYTDGSSNIFKAYYYGEIIQDVYSAFIASTGVVSGENIDWISGNAVWNGSGSGTLNITAVSSIFSVIPNGTGVLSDAAVSNANFSLQYTRALSSTATFVFFATANATMQARDCTIYIQKTGIDAVRPDWSR